MDTRLYKCNKYIQEKSNYNYENANLINWRWENKLLIPIQKPEYTFPGGIVE